MVHADDTDITMVGKNDYKQLLEIAENTFKTIELSVNHDNFGIDNNVGKVEKLSFFLILPTLKREIVVCQVALKKYHVLRNNLFHKITAESLTINFSSDPSLCLTVPST